MFGSIKLITVVVMVTGTASDVAVYRGVCEGFAEDHRRTHRTEHATELSTAV